MYDFKLQPHRRVLILTNEAIYLLSISPKLPPNFQGKKGQPIDPDAISQWYYGLHRRIALADIRSIVCSKLADDFVVVNVNNQHSSMFACVRKTEFFAVLQQEKSSIRVSFENTFVFIYDKQN